MRARVDRIVLGMLVALETAYVVGLCWLRWGA